MKTILLQILKPGLQTTIQDQGRFGYQAYGVSTSGVMDQQSASQANYLVGNNSDTPVLEITLLGPTIEIMSDCQIALTGANLSPKINGELIALYETLNIAAGSVLSFGRIQNGCRCYLAIRGEWQMEKWLGSFSAAVPSTIRLPKNSFLKKGSILLIKAKDAIPKRKIEENLRPSFLNKIELRVLAGPEFELFSKQNIAHFFSTTFQLSSDSNRMGYRLINKLITFQKKKELISSGIVKGTIQITNSGQPIILMADAQTTGGYYRIANVITADLDRLAQLKPGDELRFVLVEMEEATRALIGEKYS